MWPLAAMTLCIDFALVVASSPAFVWAACLGSLVLLAQHAAMYTLVTQPDALPGGGWLAWAAEWLQQLGWSLLIVVQLLLFPTGRLLSARWQLAAWFAGGFVGAEAILMALYPGSLASLRQDFPDVPNPVSWESARGLLELGATVVPVVSWQCSRSGRPL